jgi:CubicO group peptidase (beta-lactamase class C family)
MTDGKLSDLRLARMSAVLRGYVERGEVDGLVSLVSRRGETLVDSFGVASVGGRPVRRDTIFRIASMTKPITAVATMILVEESKLRLDEPVDRLLPELANRQVLKRLDSPLDDTVPANRPITARDLLTFRMGFGQLLAPSDAYPVLKAANDRFIGMGPPDPARIPPPGEWIRRLGALPLLYQPGEVWLYHTGADVLGVLIARASGQPFEAFLRERVFEPLGMKDTSFHVPANKRDRFTTSYWASPATGEKGVFDPAEGGEWSRPPAFPSGGAGLVSTIDDYLAFGQMLLNHGRHGNTRILSRPSVELMTMDHLTAEQKARSGLVAGFFDNHGWGFGMSVVTRRDNVAESVGTYGWEGGLGTAWTSDPREDIVVILLTNRNFTSPAPPGVFLDCWCLAYAAIDD